MFNADGNLVDRNGKSLIWNSENLPTEIVRDGNNASGFKYAPDRHRYEQIAWSEGIEETTLYLGGSRS